MGLKSHGIKRDVQIKPKIWSIKNQRHDLFIKTLNFYFGQTHVSRFTGLIGFWSYYYIRHYSSVFLHGPIRSSFSVKSSISPDFCKDCVVNEPGLTSQVLSLLEIEKVAKGIIIWMTHRPQVTFTTILNCNIIMGEKDNKNHLTLIISQRNQDHFSYCLPCYADLGINR